MGSCQPFVERIHVEAEWSGNASDAVSLNISMDVVVTTASHLALIQNDHPTVLSAQVAEISSTSRTCEEAPSLAPVKNLHLSPRGAFTLHEPILQATSTASQQDSVVHISTKQPDYSLLDSESGEDQQMHRNQSKIPFVPRVHQEPSAETVEISLFSQTASLYDATSSRDGALSPSAPSASKKLTLPKRKGIQRNVMRTLDLQTPVKHGMDKDDDQSPCSLRKRPVSLDKRPAWRPVGAEDTTCRGRRNLGIDGPKRPISRGRTRRRRSSLPGRMPKTEQSLLKLGGKKPQGAANTIPRCSLTTSPKCAGPRKRDGAGKMTCDAGAFGSSERLEKWLEDRQGALSAEPPPPSELFSDDIGSFHPPDFHGPSPPPLSSSPTPSSRAALPWTSVRGIRGGGSTDEAYWDMQYEIPMPTLVEDNGTTCLFFRGHHEGRGRDGRFRIVIQASIKLEAQQNGCHTLAVPGLPLQGGDAKGLVDLRVTRTLSSKEDKFKAHEKVAFVEEDFSIHPMKDHHASRVFRLDRPFQVSLLCFEADRILQPSDFEVDNDVYTRYDWEVLEADGIIAEYSMICSMRLRPFLMWAENVKFTLYLIGGPSGTIETILQPGKRRIYLDGKGCDDGHALEMLIMCPVADLEKAFTVSWEQSLGPAPFETWLPRISGLYRQKLEDIFDVPHGHEVSIAPKSCQNARAYSMAAQEEYLKSSRKICFFPENQYTSRIIQSSLSQKSGQFYDELTSGDLDPDVATTTSEEDLDSLKKYVFGLKRPERPRAGQSHTLQAISQDFAPRHVKGTKHDANANTKAAIADATKAAETFATDQALQQPRPIIVRIPVFAFGTLLWTLSRLPAPRRLVTVVVLAWLSLRAFDHEGVAKVEKSILSTAKTSWASWDLEAVPLHGDFSGWKHLLGKTRQGAEEIAHSQHVEVPDFIESQGEESEEGAKGELAVSKAVPEEANWSQEKDEAQPDLDQGGEFDVEGGKKDEDGLTLLDRIDLALGWKAPTRTW